MEIKKLYICDSGDPSVGIFPQSWEVDVPFYITDSSQIDEGDKEDIEFFRNKMIEIYKEFAEGRLSASYDFEFKAERDFADEVYREVKEKYPNTFEKL